MCGGGRKALFQGRRDIDHGRPAGFGGGCDFFALPLGFNERLEPFQNSMVTLRKSAVKLSLRRVVGEFDVEAALRRHLAR
jgi:hypothetical protein